MKSLHHFILLLLTQTTSSLNIVVLNQGGPEALALCTAKRNCININIDRTTESNPFNKVSFITSSDPNTQTRQYKYMYGSETDPEEETRPPISNRVQFVSSGDDIASALEHAESLIIVASESPMEVPKVSPVLQYTTKALKSVVLISRQDAGNVKSTNTNTNNNSNGGNFFGKRFFGKMTNQYKASEESFRAVLQESNSQASFCILRCGTLKGGGPGYSNLGGRLEGYETTPELGLSSILYKNNFDLTNAMTTISHDKFTLKPMIQKGDPNKMPNGFLIAAVKDSIEASPVETNICTAALVASVLVKLGIEQQQEGDLEFSLGCDKSEVFPTEEEVMDILRGLL